METKAKNTKIAYARTQFQKAKDLESLLSQTAAKIRSRRGIRGPSDDLLYRRIAYQLQASTHVEVAPTTVELVNRLPDYVDAFESYKITIRIFDENSSRPQYGMDFVFRFGKSITSSDLTYRIVLDEPSTLVSEVNQYQRYAISEWTGLFFQKLEASSFHQIAVADDQQYAWIVAMQSTQG